MGTKICSRCVLDEKIPEIEFREDGVCNYCELHDQLCVAFPNDRRGQKYWDSIVKQIRQRGSKGKYDCVVGISGGVDSTYLLHLAKKVGLRPLAVHVDNGWDSAISLSNVENVIKKLKIDLHTCVIEWEEMKDILSSFLRASYIWADGPTDIALVSTLYRVAASRGIKYILVGNNFRTEGRQPIEWTHLDSKIIKYIHKKYGRLKSLPTYPNLSNFDLFKYEFLLGIKMVKPLYCLDYDKEKAKKVIASKYSWADYGSHHYESIFTRFIIGFWLPVKFNVDKRKITFSAQIRSGFKTRESVLEELKKHPYSKKQMQLDRKQVIERLGLTNDEFETIMKSENKTFRDFPSYFKLHSNIVKHFRFMFGIFKTKPMMAFDLPSYKKFNNG